MTIVTDQPIRRSRKLDHDLDGTRKIFLHVGFERASVDDIARKAGVSKAAIYARYSARD